jgi:AcrR family transcriptional regulator
MSRLKAPQRREQLLAAATKIFARFGYDATTTHAIAKAAGITEPILYRHFKGKQELFVAITRQVSRETIEHWQELIAGAKDARDQILIIAREFPEHLKKLADAYNVIHGALASTHDRKVHSVLKDHYLEIEKFFSGIFRRGQKAGDFRTDVDPKVPAWQLIDLGIGYSMIMPNLPMLDGFSSKRAVEFILQGMKVQGGKKPSKKKVESRK